MTCDGVKAEAEDGDVLVISVIGDEWVEPVERIEPLLADRDGLDLVIRSANWSVKTRGATGDEYGAAHNDLSARGPQLLLVALRNVP